MRLFRRKAKRKVVWFPGMEHRTVDQGGPRLVIGPPDAEHTYTMRRVRCAFCTTGWLVHTDPDGEQLGAQGLIDQGCEHAPMPGGGGSA